eukprot:12807661-Prorocentrum_lima.AAC.1
MTSSLVGSEMCIRDSSCRHATFCCAGCGDIRGPGSQLGAATGQISGDIPATSSMRTVPCGVSLSTRRPLSRA